MRWMFLVINFFFIGTILGFGFPVSMSLKGLSFQDDQYIYVSTHESIVRLMGRSEDIYVSCPDQGGSVCVRPIDYSHLRANIPVFFETCITDAQKPICDEPRMHIKFTSRDLITIGLIR